MLEYKREWERISSKAEKVEKEWKDSHRALSELEACWAKVRAAFRSAAALVIRLFLTLTRSFFLHSLLVCSFTQLVEELREVVGDQAADVEMLNGHAGMFLYTCQAQKTLELTLLRTLSFAIRRYQYRKGTVSQSAGDRSSNNSTGKEIFSNRNIRPFAAARPASPGCKLFFLSLCRHPS